MKKMIMLLSIILLSYATVNYGQTISIPDTVVAAGTTINLPVKASALTSIGALTLKFNYNTTALTYKGFVKADVNVDPNLVSEASAGVINLAWYNTTPVTISNGVIGYLTFTLKSGSGVVSFDKPACEITAIPFANVIPTFKDGSISESVVEPVIVGLSVISARGNVNGTVNASLNVAGIDSIGSMSLKLNYDANVLSFKEIKNFVGDAASLLAGEKNGVLTVGYSSTAPILIKNGKLLDFVFTYKGDSSDITFDNTSEVTNGKAVPLKINFTKGTITANQKPVLDKVSDITVKENEKVSFVISAKDAENDPLTFTASNLPKNAAFNAATRVFDWATASGDSGKYAIKFFVSDSLGSLDSTVVNITVTYVNRSPVFINKVNADTVVMGSPYTFAFTATDPDSNALTFSVTGDDTTAKINPATGVFTWTPAYKKAGADYNFAVKVTDNGVPAKSATENLKITVTYLNVAPVWTATLTADTVVVGDTLKFRYVATDVNGDSLKYGLLNAPLGASIDSVTGAFTWIPQTQQTDSYVIEATVTDGIIAKPIVTSKKVLVVKIITAVEKSNKLPTVYKLEQNYPNPFNPTTKINYSVPQESKVVLKVYNLLGSEVAVLVNETKASGSYSVDFKASNLTSGLYIYRIEAGNYVSVKKMTLLK
ncbi:MAG: putative Ig domain-containing protein [Ignavibacteria bacterium]